MAFQGRRNGSRVREHVVRASTTAFWGLASFVPHDARPQPPSPEPKSRLSTCSRTRLPFCLGYRSRRPWKAIVRIRVATWYVGAMRTIAFICLFSLVSQVAAGEGTSFTRDVIPALTKAGCNQGACHAAQHGKGGFKLSLFGYAPDEDHIAITRDQNQRRISTVRAADSLILKKATMTIPHGGGKVLKRNSRLYKIIHRWIAAGAPGPEKTDKRLVGTTVSPKQGVYKLGDQRQLKVIARFEDNTQRDVTSLARFDSFSQGTVAVSKQGRMTITGRGQGIVMIRYRGQAKVARMLSPFRTNVGAINLQQRNLVDKHSVNHWKKLGLLPSRPCSEEEFIRRVCLDATGTLPTPKAIQAFLKSADPKKRSKLIDEVLGLTKSRASRRYKVAWEAYWAQKWGDLLKNNRKKSGDTGMWSMHNWLRQSMRNNKPIDQLVRELLTATGSGFQSGPVNFIAYSPRPTDLPRVASPADLAETTAQMFLGVRLQCARCHHHPFEVYSQDDYYGLAAFFTRMTSKSSFTFGELGFDAVVSVARSGQLTHPKKKHVVKPKLLLDKEVDPSKFGDLRQPLADWLTSPANKLFSRNIVNRVWAEFMGRGLVEPVDDVRATNPPSNPELLSALADDFAQHKFNLKHLMRRIMNSSTYQLSSRPRPENSKYTRYYTHYNVKRLPAEVLLDAIDSACGTREKFEGVPLGTRAIDLPDPNFDSYFLDTLGRPQRVVACECERTSQPNLAQVLQIANGEMLQRKLSHKAGRVVRLMKNKMTDGKAIEQLYLVTFSRPPTTAETNNCKKILKKSASRQSGLENILWALCNSREFLFNH